MKSWQQYAYYTIISTLWIARYSQKFFNYTLFCQATVNKKIMDPRIVLISGCSSGIGLATAVLLSKDAGKRFKVYATMRNLAKKGQLEEEGKEYLGDTLIIKQMDVCSDESVSQTVQELVEMEGKIDVLCKYRDFSFPGPHFSECD